MFYTSAYIFLTDTFSVGDSTWLAHYEWMPPLFVSLSSRDLPYDGYLAKNNNAFERAMKYKIIFHILIFIYSGQVAIFLRQLYRCPTTHGHSLPRFMSDSSRIIARNRSNWIVSNQFRDCLPSPPFLRYRNLPMLQYPEFLETCSTANFFTRHS